jgi:hypothetical protein
MDDRKIIFLSIEKKKNITELLREKYEKKLKTENILEKYIPYFLIYEERYCPPFWIGKQEYQEIIWKYGKDTVVYYDNTYHKRAGNIQREPENPLYGIEGIKKLASEREPTNIQFIRSYKHDTLKENYGYEICPYNEFFHPNIAIYCKTPLYMDLYGSGQHKYINVLSVIAPAFDVEEQPDYIRYSKVKETRSDLYKEEMTRMFRKIVHCFKTKGFKNLIMAGVGMVNFKILAHELGIDAEQIFLTCCIEQFADIFKAGSDKKLIFNLVSFINDRGIKESFNKSSNITSIKVFFPEITGQFTQDELNETLFINAWDPFSIVGNGNKGDGSLDGYIGRHTAAGILSWPIFNEKIKYEAINPEHK